MAYEKIDYYIYPSQGAQKDALTLSGLPSDYTVNQLKKETKNLVNKRIIALKEFESQQTCRLNMESFLGNFKKKNSGKIDYKKYSIVKRYGYGYNIDENYKKVGKIFGDTYYRFILSLKGKYVAFLGFNPTEESILILQNQGIKGKKEILKHIHWYEALHQIALDWAKNLEINESHILPISQSKWNIVKKNEFGTYRYYDGVARKNDYSYDEKRKLFIKKLR